MKCISRRGLTYNVYDMGDGRVLKKEKALFYQYFLHLPFNHSPRYVHKHKRQAERLMSVLGEADFLGRPKFLSSRSYTQDMVSVFDSYIETHSLEDNKHAIDVYIQHIFTTWSYGFSDIIFNFTRNCGVLSDGKVALIDFNEITFQKEIVAEKILAKRWLKAYSYWKDLQDEPLKAYYAKTMAEAMTLDNLDRYWKDNAKLLDKTQ